MEGDNKFGTKHFLILVLALLFLAVLVYAFKYYLDHRVQLPPIQEGERFIAERTPLDPTTFTYEDVLQDLHSLELGAIYTFDTNLPRIPVEGNLIPEEISRFIYLHPATKLVVERSVSENPLTYYISYKADGSLPDNHMRLSRTANPKDFKLIQWKMRKLASMTEIESANYEIHISQLAESEEATNVTIYARVKQP